MCICVYCLFFVKQKTAYEMRISDWSSDVCSSDLPSNFAGWDSLADVVRERLARMPEGARLVAGNFKIGAELGFALGEADIPVLDHPLNRAHGRAPQLQLWGLHPAQRFERPPLLVVGASAAHSQTLLNRKSLV